MLHCVRVAIYLYVFSLVLGREGYSVHSKPCQPRVECPSMNIWNAVCEMNERWKRVWLTKDFSTGFWCRARISFHSPHSNAGLFGDISVFHWKCPPCGAQANGRLIFGRNDHENVEMVGVIIVVTSIHFQWFHLWQSESPTTNSIDLWLRYLRAECDHASPSKILFHTSSDRKCVSSSSPSITPYRSQHSICVRRNWTFVAIVWPLIYIFWF